MNQNNNIQTIYIRMIDGVETFIPVDAKLVSDNVFQIIDNKYTVVVNAQGNVVSVFSNAPGTVGGLGQGHFIPFKY